MTHGLVQMDFNGRSCLKTEYFFRPEHVPENYNEVLFFFHL